MCFVDSWAKLLGLNSFSIYGIWLLDCFIWFIIPFCCRDVDDVTILADVGAFFVFDTSLGWVGFDIMFYHGTVITY